MSEITKLIEERRIGDLSAHPDDHLIHGHAIQAALKANSSVRELVLTKGLNGKNLRLDEPDYVQNGYRVIESASAALHLGMQSIQHMDGTDGGLHLPSQMDFFAEQVAKWVRQERLDVLLTAGDLTDHTDHAATAEIARRASGILAVRYNYSLDLLELQTDLRDEDGLWVADATPESTAIIIEAAMKQKSQFNVRMAEDEPDWQIVGDYALDAEAYQGLSTYPINRPAYYKFVQSNAVAMALEAA